jgi:SNF2 family DNA or RNA helicase
MAVLARLLKAISKSSRHYNTFSLSPSEFILTVLYFVIDLQGGRALVFSAYTQALDLIESYIKTFRYSILRMDETTPRQKRQVGDFVFSCFLSSTSL